MNSFRCHSDPAFVGERTPSDSRLSSLGRDFSGVICDGISFDMAASSLTGVAWETLGSRAAGDPCGDSLPLSFLLLIQSLISSQTALKSLSRFHFDPPSEINHYSARLPQAKDTVGTGTLRVGLVALLAFLPGQPLPPAQATGRLYAQHRTLIFRWPNSATPLVEFGQSRIALLGYSQRLSVGSASPSLRVCGSEGMASPARKQDELTPGKCGQRGSPTSLPRRKMKQAKVFASTLGATHHS